MASSGQEIEIGWKKELLDSSKEDACGNRHRSRSPGRKKKKYHRLSSESSSSTSDGSRSTSSSSGSSSEDGKKKKKGDRKEKREKRKEERKLKQERRRLDKEKKKEIKKAKKEKRKEEKRLKKMHKKMNENAGDSLETDCAVPIDLMFSKARAPETAEEYEARQKQIRRVTDPETGRSRLIKGDGEILEEIVSKERHREINRNATQGDGYFFQSKTVGWHLNK